ncbi:MAG TPA: NTP transferase domain-containing protein, partial [Gemmatimonadaceae bacterium]|nr:NTP transferase domain-containing protein [Gemmatimonadaceae bacterium]
GVVILLADMVRVTSDMVRMLIASATDDVSLAVSRYGDVLAPPLLFRRSLWPELLAWHGEGCGKAVVKAHVHEALMHDWPADALRDVDTPDDYDALTRP